MDGLVGQLCMLRLRWFLAFLSPSRSRDIATVLVFICNSQAVPISIPSISDSNASGTRIFFRPAWLWFRSFIP